ncbi:hypothetical protein EPK84_22295 [Sinorhizobium fredii]|nr:hypothetical protein EPK84_22295 [Sinorhizobium fredii]
MRRRAPAPLPCRKGAFRQAERIFRAARRKGATVQIDLRTLVVTLLPAPTPPASPPTRLFRPGGVESWDD